MNRPDARVLAEVPISVYSRQLRLDEALASLQYLLGDAYEEFESSLSAVAIRALEISILSDPTIVDLALNNGVFLGADERILRERVNGLLGTSDVPEALITHLLRLVRSKSAGAQRKANNNLGLFRDVLDLCSPSRGSELRCLDCGYHFTTEDLGLDRLAIVDDMGIELAPEQNARRIRDPWKPAQRSECTLDHVVPEAGFGWSDSKNLRILCSFCNKERQIYRWPGETIGRSVAAGLLGLGGVSSRGEWAVRAATYVCISRDGACSVCSRTSAEVELTARSRSGVRDMSSLLPWLLAATCYDCFDPGAE